MQAGDPPGEWQAQAHAGNARLRMEPDGLVKDALLVTTQVPPAQRSASGYSKRG